MERVCALEYCFCQKIIVHRDTFFCTFWNKTVVINGFSKGCDSWYFTRTETLCAGEAVGLASIPIDGNTEGDASQSSLLWNVVRRALKQGPVTSWPAVENKTYPLSQPRKMVCLSHFIPILAVLLQSSGLTMLELLNL